MKYQLPHGVPPAVCYEYDGIHEMSDAIVDEVEAHGATHEFTDDAYAACGIGRGIMLALADPKHAKAMLQRRFTELTEPGAFTERLAQYRRWIADRPIHIEREPQ